jgi:hypothetical protein
MPRISHESARACLDFPVQHGSKNAKRRESGGHCQRIPRERPRLVHRPRRRHALHEIATTAVRRGGKSTADDLAQRDQVGAHAKALTRSAGGNAKAGHDLVEDEQRTRGVARRPQGTKELEVGRNEAAVADHGLDDDGSQAITVDGRHLA